MTVTANFNISDLLGQAVLVLQANPFGALVLVLLAGIAVAGLWARRP